MSNDIIHGSIVHIINDRGREEPAVVLEVLEDEEYEEPEEEKEEEEEDTRTDEEKKEEEDTRTDEERAEEKRNRAEDKLNKKRTNERNKEIALASGKYDKGRMRVRSLETLLVLTVKQSGEGESNSWHEVGNTSAGTPTPGTNAQPCVEETQ